MEGKIDNWEHYLNFKMKLYINSAYFINSVNLAIFSATVVVIVRIVNIKSMFINYCNFVSMFSSM